MSAERHSLGRVAVQITSGFMDTIEQLKSTDLEETEPKA